MNMNDRFVRIRPSETRPITWTMDYEGRIGSGKEFPLVDLPQNSGAHFITFTIDNPDGMDIEFSRDPIWIQEGFECPDHATIDRKQIKEIRRHNRTQLVIKDINKGDERYLAYQLNFVDGNDRSHEVSPLDPQIKNGGGTGPGQGFVVEARHAVIGAAILAVAFIAYRLFLER